MRVGFTGTQQGMTGDQELMLRNLIGELNEEDVGPVTSFHHGDCTGADAEAHDSIRREFPDILIHIHPPTNPRKRAFKEGDHENGPLPYIQRNHRIVDDTGVLIATPHTDTEQLRSGTWATIRYARTRNRKIYIIYPDGTVNDD